MRDKSGKRNLLLAATIVGLGLSTSMNPACADDLWDAINTAASAGLYTLNSDYTLPDGKSSLGNLKVGVFVLEGNNKSIELNKKSGVSIDDDKSMTIRNAIIKNAKNSAEGGAIYNEGKLEITGSQFNDDHADDDDAGAIWNEGTISKILADFNNNGATDNGGRNGVGLQAGFTWALGGGKDKKADEHKIQKSLKRAPELKKTEITLKGR